MKSVFLNICIHFVKRHNCINIKSRRHYVLPNVTHYECLFTLVIQVIQQIFKVHIYVDKIIMLVFVNV